MEKYLESLNKAVASLKTADHMLYMTYPLIREKRLLLKILNETYISVLNIINAILQYEYLYKRIQLYKDSKDNFQTFKRCALRYGITEDQIKKIIEILSLTEKHKESPLEFIRKDKIVIVTNSLKTDTVTVEKMKDYVLTTKDLLRKAENKMKNSISNH